MISFSGLFTFARASRHQTRQSQGCVDLVSTVWETLYDCCRRHCSEQCSQCVTCGQMAFALDLCSLARDCRSVLSWGPERPGHPRRQIAQESRVKAVAAELQRLEAGIVVCGGVPGLEGDC